MSAVLTAPAMVSGVAAGPDAGLLAAVIVAASATALVAIGMMIVALRRSRRLSGIAGVATAGLALGVVSIAVGGVVAVSPAAAHAAPDEASPYVVVSSTDVDSQLPTLAR